MTKKSKAQKRREAENALISEMFSYWEYVNSTAEVSERLRRSFLAAARRFAREVSK